MDKPTTPNINIANTAATTMNSAFKILLPAITQYVWFVAGGYYPTFYMFVPAFHGLQYLLIAWMMQLKEKADNQGIETNKPYVIKESARWGIVNFLLGAFLFYWLPRLCTYVGYSLTFSIGIVIAGVQIHHFFVDGVIWKLKNKRVSSPLMVNLNEMLHGQKVSS